MNICFQHHVSDDALEKHAMGKASIRYCRHLEEHLLLCADCQTRLMKIEEFILVMRAALQELEIQSDPRFNTPSALAV